MDTENEKRSPPLEATQLFPLYKSLENTKYRKYRGKYPLPRPWLCISATHTLPIGICSMNLI